jgi:arylsulfatase A-like enzyme
MDTLSRRMFMGVTGTGAVAWGLSNTRSQAPRSPNVILILSDDQGSADVGCYGAADLHTPHLDGLAVRGVRFTSSYVAASICSPSRGALLTGRCPRRNGLETNAGGDTGLPESEVLLPQLFKEAGYHTAIFGKWHLGMQASMGPTARGFDEFFGHKEGCIDNYSHFFYWHGPNRHDLWRNTEQVHEDGAFFPDLVTREALRFIEAHQQEPFFLYLPYNLPHYPMQAKPGFEALYKDLPEEPRRYYAAFVSTLDACIGQVVNKVDALGLRENTIILFLSDNGHSVEERAFFGGGSAGPFRGHKFTLWEGGLRTPCIVSWPGVIPSGEVREQIISSMDWFPTLARHCTLTLPDILLDGRDITGVIRDRNAPSPHDALHWMSNEQWAVRKGPWKLVYQTPESRHAESNTSQDSFFLSNLEEDPGESVNRAPRYPELQNELMCLHEQWRNATVR